MSLKRQNTMEQCASDAQAFLNNENFWNAFSKRILQKNEKRKPSPKRKKSPKRSNSPKPKKDPKPKKEKKDDEGKSPKKKKKKDRIYKPKPLLKKSPKRKSKAKREEKVDEARKEDKEKEPKKEKKEKEKEKKKEKEEKKKEKKKEKETEHDESGSEQSDDEKERSKEATDEEDSENESGNESDSSKLIRQKSIIAGVDLPDFGPDAESKDKKQIQFLFNTTDSPKVRECLVTVIKSLLNHQTCEVSVGLISNGKGDAPNLQELNFSKNQGEIIKIISDSAGEGKNWKKYMGMVLEKANSFKWSPKPPNKLAFLMLVGSEDCVDALTASLNDHNDFSASIAKLKKSHVGVFAFNPQQLDLLVEVTTKYLS